MVADAQGNDLQEVGIPITGRMAYAPYASANVILSEDGGSRDFALLTDYSAYQVVGLIKTDGGFEDASELGDKIEFFQQSYELAGDDTLTTKVGVAQNHPIVRELVRGIAPDANGMIIVRGASNDKLYLGFTEVVYKPVGGASRGMIERRNGVFRISEIERDTAERGSVRGWNITIKWVPDELFDGGHFAEWILPPLVTPVTP